MNQIITQVHHTTKDELVDKIINGVSQELVKFEKNFQPKEPSVWITKKEVATVLSVSTVTIDDWSKKGILSRYRIGNRIRFKRSEVEQALTRIND